MAVPDFQSLLYPTLELIADGQPRDASTIERNMVERFRISDADRNEMLGKVKRTRLMSNIYWALTYLRQARLIESTGGRHRITLRGADYFKSATPPIGMKDLRVFPEFVEFQKRRSKNNGDIPPQAATQQPDLSLATPEPSVPVSDVQQPCDELEERQPRDHEEIQWLLLKLGSDMGLDTWVARNDRGRQVNGNKFAEIPRIKKDLPLQFDDVTNRTIQLIDVLWLQGNAIAAAFEIESTTSIYSGLLRMSDLLAMQPNLNIPLFLVAPEERREKVVSEVNRPTFSRRNPPLSTSCRFLSFTALRNSAKETAGYVRHLKPEFLREISESCDTEQASG